MIIATEKKRSNIVEYVLYMWYIEDVIRASGFDIRCIRGQVLDQFSQPAEVKQQMEQWYSGLMERMLHEGLNSAGHLRPLVDLVYDLNDLHLSLINDPTKEEYRQLYHTTQPYIAELKRKMRPEITEMEACLNGLYGTMMLRLKREEPSASTLVAMSHFSTLLAHLNHYYMNNSSGRSGSFGQA